MIRSTYALVLVVCGGLVLSACGKKNDNGDSSSGSAAASGSAAPSAAPSASASAPPADTASAAPSSSASAPPVDTTAPVVGAVPQRPIDDCCIALATVATSRRRGNRIKKDSFRAAEICPGIAALVRSGRATRQQALTQIKSAMVGEPVPGACR